MTGPRPKAGVAWALLLSLVSSPLTVTLAAVLGAPGAAWAQTDAQQKAAAEALFDEGKQLLSQGQFESACRRFEQSQEIDPGVGTLLYLGDCYERSGRLASAWAIYREASSAAAAAGQGERTRIADERARRLAPSLSKLVLLVPQENRVPGFELLLDNRVLSPALFGVPFPIDAGQHEISARAPGRSNWSNVIEIKPNAD
jgi:tetratricopeptide (TPR) repeat protein